MANRSTGKLIVIDGSDGVGKATQTKLLVERLRKEKIKVRAFDFPHYENFFGALIGKCLAGEYGDFVGLDPRIASVLYAADRFESKKLIEKWLTAGYSVVIDRYVSANQIHQGGKIRDAKKRREFLSWLDTLEHTVFGIPRPDLIICLNLPVAISTQLLKEKVASQKKIYLKKGLKDQVENDIRYLLNSQKSALQYVKAHNQWVKIECVNKQEILPREVIHEKIFHLVKPLLKL